MPPFSLCLRCLHPCRALSSAEATYITSIPLLSNRDVALFLICWAHVPVCEIQLSQVRLTHFACTATAHKVFTDHQKTFLNVADIKTS